MVVIVGTIFPNRIPIIPIAFKNAHSRYTGLKRPIDNKLANITTLTDFSYFSLHLYH